MGRSVRKPFTAAVVAAALPFGANAGVSNCEIASGDRLMPVIELYTSEGCSSCPPADQWLSGLKGKPVVAQAFHVAYWDYIGWADRFAMPSFAARQKEVAQVNGLRGISTPQVVRNGRDWPQWRSALHNDDFNKPARAAIVLRGQGGSNAFVAHVAPTDANGKWTAYWTVTEHQHASRVKAGENAGETLQHDFVVTQYTPAGRYQGAHALRFHAVAAHADHPRQVNLVVSDAQTGEPLQALSLQCP